MPFANEAAITTLINSDGTATPEEKSRAIRAVTLPPEKQKPDGDVVSFRRAAEILGYKSARAVRKSLHAGVLQGFYGGALQQRCTGIVTDSIYQVLGKPRPTP